MIKPGLSGSIAFLIFWGSGDVGHLVTATAEFIAPLSFMIMRIIFIKNDHEVNRRGQVITNNYHLHLKERHFTIYRLLISLTGAEANGGTNALSVHAITLPVPIPENQSRSRENACPIFATHRH
ncbi:MAG: hypothetical protein WBA20_00575 [Ketobacter sp.]